MGNKNKNKNNFRERDKFMTYMGNKAGKGGKNHPHYIYAEKGHKYISFGITTTQFVEEDNGTVTENAPLQRNPNPKDNRKSYARPTHISDQKRNYTKDKEKDYDKWGIDADDRKVHIPPKWKK